MRIYSKAPLRDFWESHDGCREALSAWYKATLKATWKSPSDVKAEYASVSILSNERLCFNIKGNAFRLIVAVSYERGVVFIKWVGTHRDYSRVNAETIGGL